MISRLSFFALLGFALLAVGCSDDASVDPSMDEEPPEEEPPPASSLELSAETEREAIGLSWDGSGLESAERFRVYRSTEANFDTTGAFLAETHEKELKDRDIDPSEEYHYSVAAFEGSDAIELSDEEKTLAPPPKLKSVEGEGGFYETTLQWDEPDVEAVEGYAVYRSDGSFGEADEAERISGSLPVDSASFTDDEILDGETYYYRVAAVDRESNEGPLSEEMQVTPSFEGDALRGAEIYEAECSVCHANADAADLQAFAFADTTIHRRSAPHIGEQETFDVIEFVRSRDIPERPDAELGTTEVPPFQPGGRVLGSDEEFAMELFGKDEWPEDLTREELLEKHPAEQPIPFEMPRWSDESNKFDWVAQRPLPDRFAEDPGVQDALETYRATRTDANLVRLWRAIQEARPDNNKYRHATVPNGVTTEDEYADILAANRWISALIGGHALRSGDERQALRDIMEMTVDGKPVRGRTTPFKEMWTVGDMFRLARLDAKPGRDISHFVVGLPDSYASHYSDYLLPTVQWFYLSWMFAHESFEFDFTYFSGLMGDGWALGYKRVQAYMTAYTIAALRLDRGGMEYAVMQSFHENTPEHWQPNLLDFVLDTLLYHIDNGRQVKYDHEHAIPRFNEPVEHVLENNPYLTDEERKELDQKREEIIEYLEEQKEIHG